MNKRVSNAMTSEKTILGFRPADLFGILVMIIPCAISYFWYEEIPIKILGFIDTKKTETINIWPNAITAIFAVAFYAALIVRYDFFKSANLGQAIISAIRTFLDCWVLSALLSFVIPTKDATASFFATMFQNTQLITLLFAVILTWLGMKSIAGYGWIIFIVVASKHLIEVNNSFGRLGAVFIITSAISLFLQVKDLSTIQDFLDDFKSSSRQYTSQVKGSINGAIYDAKQGAYVVTNYVKKHSGQIDSSTEPYVPHLTLTPDKPQGPEPISRSLPQEEEVKINFAALDVNKDGVVDDKDLLLIQQMRGKE